MYGRLHWLKYGTFQQVLCLTHTRLTCDPQYDVKHEMRLFIAIHQGFGFNKSPNRHQHTMQNVRPWKWWAHLCALRAPLAEERGTTLTLACGRRAGALKQSSASGGCRPKRWEQIQHRPLLASRASPTSIHRPDRAMAAEPCSQIEAGGHLSGVFMRLYR